MMNKQEIREHLTGPIPSIRTPFFQDGEIDYGALRIMIDAAIDAGARTVLLTAGDSHYLCLSDEEIAEVTRVTCEHTAKRAMVVAADRYHSTHRAVEWAKQAAEMGADVAMCMPPDWAGSCTPETLAAHYAAVAKIQPVMIVTNVFVPRGIEFGLQTVELALDQSENIVAIKDDMCGEFARRLCLLAHERCAIFAGGQKQNHMNMLPYGCDGYLSTLLTFMPYIANRYWTSVASKELEVAREVIREVDMPLFDYLAKLRGGFDAGIHAIYEHHGMAERWRRPPYYSLNDEEMKKLEDFLKQHSLL